MYYEEVLLESSDNPKYQQLYQNIGVVIILGVGAINRGIIIDRYRYYGNLIANKIYSYSTHRCDNLGIHTLIEDGLEYVRRVFF